ncbi:TrbI/VirB10 family protein [uncultured Reyranella sp.]|jgi:type IV secretion system protein VirB10|uniref:TrbI/VirB10 family protein n=1 Tax=uncultured Reyranella sp. TaxID=735512 RepID=UPI00259D0EA1|nr:TrbI/VirB10 family protein [uncultured Reyranella sp.]
MTDQSLSDSTPLTTAQPFRLRSEGPRVTRLSRTVLIGGTALGLILVCGAILWALQGDRLRSITPQELYTTDRSRVADGLAALPRDYTGVPQDVPPLGPPLPGDLGRPIVAAQGQPAPSSPDPEQQRRAQETEAARVSRLFAPGNRQTQPGAASIPPSQPSMPATAPSGDEASIQNGQDRKLAFTNGPVDRKTTSPDRLARPASPFVLQAGAVIPAALITGLRSDLPGQITAQVTENVYDTPTGGALLIPQGARLIGVYDSQVSFGQSRLLLVWTRLLLPNGYSIVLERQPGADSSGQAGLEDGVDHHWGSLFKAALLSTILAVGTEVGSDQNDSDLVRALRRGAGDTLNQAGQQVVRRNLNIQPTLTIRPGFPVRVIVTRDLVLQPYRG